MGYDQVVLKEAEHGVNISLQDMDGIFWLVVDLGQHDGPPWETVVNDTAEVDEQWAARDLEIAKLKEQLKIQEVVEFELWRDDRVRQHYIG